MHEDRASATPLEIRRLRHFIALAQEMNFGRAAARLSIAQPPLSRMIQQMETNLGVSLIDRTRSQIRLTQAGELLKARAELILEQVDRAVRDVRVVGRGMSGILRIGFVGSATHGVFPELIQRFRAAYPDVELRLDAMNNAQSHDQLTTRAIDAAIVRPGFKDANLRQVVIQEETLVLAAPEIMADRLASLLDLAGVPLVLYPRKPRPSFADFVLDACDACGYVPADVIWAQDYQTAISLVSVGVGASIVPKSCGDSGRPGVAFLPLREKLPMTRLSLCARTDNQSPHLFQLFELCRALQRQKAGS